MTDPTPQTTPTRDEANTWPAGCHDIGQCAVNRGCQRRACLHHRRVIEPEIRDALPAMLAASPPPAASPEPPSGDAVAFPAYGEMPFSELGSAVKAAQFGAPEPYEFDPEFYPGHQIVGTINFNSLNRIVTWFVKRALASDATPAPTSGSEDGDGPVGYRWRFHNGDWNYTGATPVEGAFAHLHHQPLYLLSVDRDLLAKPASEPAGGDVDALRKAAEEFCRRVEAGEIRSKRSYAAFKAALSSSAGPAAANRIEWLEGCLAAADKHGEEYEALYNEMHDRFYAHPAPATVEMREALKPFAKVAERYDGVEHIRRLPALEPYLFDLTIEHFRQARAALAPATEGRKS